MLVVLGDHQPLPLITGEGASRDVPISVVTRDQGVLQRIAPWGWAEGLHPGRGGAGLADGGVPGPLPQRVRPVERSYEAAMLSRSQPSPRSKASSWAANPARSRGAMCGTAPLSATPPR